MKKKLYIFAILILLLLLLSSCQDMVANPDDSQDESEATTTYYSYDPYKPLHLVKYPIGSYERLLFDFSTEANSQNSLIQREKSYYGENFQAFVEFLTESDSIPLPKINGGLMPLRNQEGFSNINVYVSELYDLPWIWYHGKYEGKDIRVIVTYPESMLNIKIDSQSSVDEIIRLVSPNAANIDNYQNYPSCERVYLKEIQLQGKKVSAIIYEYKDTQKIYVIFYDYDNKALIRVQVDKSMLDNDFWKSFSMGR